jgi:hypothetical protein
MASAALVVAAGIHMVMATRSDIPLRALSLRVCEVVQSSEYPVWFVVDDSKSFFSSLKHIHHWPPDEVDAILRRDVGEARLTF